MIRSYEDIEAYRKSYNSALKVYEVTKGFPKEEMYGISSQVKRAALSIPLNIAEGYGKRESAAEFKRYLAMSKGSCNEVQVLIRFTKDLGYIDDKNHDALIEAYDEIGKMLSGLIKNWK